MQYITRVHTGQPTGDVRNFVNSRYLFTKIYDVQVGTAPESPNLHII
jgi:hypothetical protein